MTRCMDCLNGACAAFEAVLCVLAFPVFLVRVCCFSEESKAYEPLDEQAAGSSAGGDQGVESGVSGKAAAEARDAAEADAVAATDVRVGMPGSPVAQLGGTPAPSNEEAAHAPTEEQARAAAAVARDHAAAARAATAENT